MFVNMLDNSKSLCKTINEEISIIMQARKTVLFHGNKSWVKKFGNKGFDVSMEWFDGGKVSEIVGTYILSKISNEIKIELDFTVAMV